ncbi:hypothetical protein RF11_02497 [Thelohanellus kitauei]|uniref:Tc1-like transposase DDE domain-containing protein n=1 Tax=Thelohanellus kitauei TaxID=669202 RepID=A0A0C2IZX2_THEKT|nr:hypothetical protein RF11_02497 [Thelohanellus kitauei]
MELLSLIIAALKDRENFTEIKTLFNEYSNGKENLYKRGWDRKSYKKAKKSLCDILKEYCSRTIHRIFDLFFEWYNIRIGRSTAKRCFKNFQYSLKIVRLILERHNDPQNILAKKEYTVNFLRIAPDLQKVFFIDETCFQIFEIFPAREISEANLVMNNVSFHKTALVPNTIREFNPVPIYFPPYSPF